MLTAQLGTAARTGFGEIIVGVVWPAAGAEGINVTGITKRVGTVKEEGKQRAGPRVLQET